MDYVAEKLSYPETLATSYEVVLTGPARLRLTEKITIKGNKVLDFRIWFERDKAYIPTKFGFFITVDQAKKLSEGLNMILSRDNK